MRFFRGLAVPEAKAGETVEEIRKTGLVNNAWFWRTEHRRPLPGLLEKPDLSLEDTRPKGMPGTPAVCACGELDGASYYAWSHNRSSTNDTPIIIEFEADIEQVAIDGKDCLYTVFQKGAPDRASGFVRGAFGEKGLSYAERAWQIENQGTRIALCDLAIHDPEVIAAHHSNHLVIAGRHRTVYRNAFTVDLPVPPERVLRVWTPESRPTPPIIDMALTDLLLPR